MAKEKKQVERITDMEVDFAKWYTDICLKAELVDYASGKGFLIPGAALFGGKGIIARCIRLADEQSIVLGREP